MKAASAKANAPDTGEDEEDGEDAAGGRQLIDLAEPDLTDGDGRHVQRRRATTTA